MELKLDFKAEQEALTLINDALAEFRAGKMEKFDDGVKGDTLEILFGNIAGDIVMDIYYISDYDHEDTIAGYVLENFNEWKSLTPWKEV